MDPRTAPPGTETDLPAFAPPRTATDTLIRFAPGNREIGVDQVGQTLTRETLACWNQRSNCRPRRPADEICDRIAWIPRGSDAPGGRL